MKGTVLVTGGAGFIGSHLTDSLVADGHRVTVLDNLSTGSRENLSHALGSERVELVEGSVLDPDTVDRCMRTVDSCIHLAAWVGVKRIVGHPLDALRENVLGTDVVMAAAARHRRRLLFSSSSELYGKLNQGGLTESDDRLLGSPQKSRWSYAIAKEFGEALAQAYVEECRAEMIVVRLFNTVGPRQASAYGMVVPRLVRQALAGSPLTVYGDGAQTRCFTDVHDVVRALRQLLAADGAVGGVFNVGSPRAVRVVDLARMVIERTGSTSPIVFVPYAQAHPAGFEELGNRSPDTSALHRLTGWSPHLELRQTVDSIIAFELDRALAPDDPQAARGGTPPPLCAIAA
jgi:UDP-glucose 4-epimerase